MPSSLFPRRPIRYERSSLMRWMSLVPVWLAASVAGGPEALLADEPAVELQPRRTFEFQSDGVEITQDFQGGAVSNVHRTGPDHYEATIAPENRPINRSPWYAFRITAEEKTTVTVTLTYDHGRHRYHPKISRNGIDFAPLDGEHFQENDDQGTAQLTVEVGPEPVWIAAQELFTSKDYQQWMDRLAEKEAVERRELGESPGSRKLSMLTIGRATREEQDDVDTESRYVLLLGRQHPPELSGGVAMWAFVETLAGDTDLAERFRRAFGVLAVPLVNPDGVDRGFWRHNFGGKDLNRDWGPFMEVETRLVRDAILEQLSKSSGRVFVGIDFHSTFRNVFYTASDKAEVEPEGFVADWLEAIRERHPNVELPESASHNPHRTNAKTWFIERFGAPGITYEVADDFDRDTTRAVARTAAKAMMRLLLAEVSETDKADDTADESLFRFEHHFADSDVPGRNMGQTDLADLDGDGKLDFITGQQHGTIYWYEYRAPDKWVRHILGRDSPSDVGGAAMDVNGDGAIDFVTGGAWYENAGESGESEFRRHVFDPQLNSVHDILIGDIDGDGEQDVITMADTRRDPNNELRWYRIPEKPTERWRATSIGEPTHSGISLGDLDGDGDLDVVRSNVWFENQKRGRQWRMHQMTEPWGARRPSFAINATQTETADLNGDGRLDVVIGDGENPDSKIAWLEAPEDPRGGQWTVHHLPRSDDAPRGALHSLKLADFNNNGRPEILAVEMERFPGARPPRWFLWRNVDGKGNFQEHVILDARLGGHETVVGDVDADGDIDIASKPWTASSDNGNGGKLHFSYLENLSNRSEAK